MEGGNTSTEHRDPYERALNSSSSQSELPFVGICSDNGGSSTQIGASGDGDRKVSCFRQVSERTASPAVGSAAARYRLMSPARLLIARSPCLTIPPGLSPTSLLDSPVLLSDVKAEPSPTTGTFSVGLVVHDTVRFEKLSSPRVASGNGLSYDESARDFESKPQSRLNSVSGLPPLGQLDSAGSSSMNVPVSSTDLSHLNQPNHNDDTGAAGAPGAVPDDAHPKDDALSVDVKNPSSLSDGYNWRKYGQKHVKGCEFPRSYYKCTYPNCEVKKLLERSHDGQIAEILYKGRHDHPKPQPNRRLAVGAVLSCQKEERSDKSNLATKDKFLTGQDAFHQNEPNATPEVSPSTHNDDSEGAGSNAAKIADETNDEDDPELKRRKIENGGIDATSMSKVTREPRVVVQTVSEVDILDDGYRWRKYGQKVVKGNPNPRSYYKCTNAGCQVRKLVERASHDPKAVITTYEGKHNHDVPSFSRTSDRSTAGCTILYEFTSPNDGPILSAGVPRYHHSEESDVISLDLGIGVSSNSGNKTNETQLSLEKEHLNQNQMSATGNEVIHAIPISAYYSGKSNGSDLFGSSKEGENWSFKSSSINNSSNAYQLGELVMGP